MNGAGACGLKGGHPSISNSLGFATLQERELALTTQAMEELKKIPHVNIIGSQDPKEHNGIVNFTVEGVHPHDISADSGSEQAWMCGQAITAPSRC